MRHRHAFEVKYENDVPISGVLAAYKLLCRYWNSVPSCELDRRWEHDYIEIRYSNDGDRVRTMRWIVSKECADTVVQLARLRGQPHWGWTDERVLHVEEVHEFDAIAITSVGKRLLERKRYRG